MTINNVFGLPAHALVVHAAVVLVPLSALAFVVAGLRSDWRRHYALPIALMAVAGAAAAILAAATGEPLESSIRHAARATGTTARFGDHPGQGDTARIFAAVFASVVVGFWAIVQFGNRFRLPDWVSHTVYAAGVVAAVAATATIVMAGHSGAQLVWNDVGTYAPR